MDAINAFDAHPNQAAKRARAATTVRIPTLELVWDDHRQGFRSIQVIIERPAEAA